MTLVPELSNLTLVQCASDQQDNVVNHVAVSVGACTCLYVCVCAHVCVSVCILCM